VDTGTGILPGCARCDSAGAPANSCDLGAYAHSLGVRTCALEGQGLRAIHIVAPMCLRLFFGNVLLRLCMLGAASNKGRPAASSARSS